MQVHCDEGPTSAPSRAQASARMSAKRRQGNVQASHRAAKESYLGADAVQMAEGNTSRRVSASARMTRRGQRPWHVQTLLAREPGDLAIDRSATAVGPHREGEEP